VTREAFTEKTARGFAALQAGDPALAVDLLEGAYEAARETEDQDLVDEARVNFSQALEQAGEHEKAEEGLREILLRTTREEVVLAAALTIARVRKSLRDLERAQFYLGRALEVAGRLGPPLRMASVLNTRANLYMHANLFDQAAEDYARALELLEQEGHEGYALVVALDNVGYCRVLMDEVEEGIPVLERAVAEAEEHGVRRYVAEASQDLCFANLKLRAAEEAEAWGRKALEVAEEEGYEDIRKNILYLLGEACSLLGRDDEARDYFRSLQEFYPGVPDLSQFLSTYDISAMITLKEF